MNLRMACNAGYKSLSMPFSELFALSYTKSATGTEAANLASRVCILYKNCEPPRYLNKNNPGMRCKHQLLPASHGATLACLKAHSLMASYTRGFCSMPSGHMPHPKSEAACATASAGFADTACRAPYMPGCTNMHQQRAQTGATNAVCGHDAES